MSYAWKDPVDADFWDAYLDFSQMVAERRDALCAARPGTPDWFDPIFVRLVADANDPVAPRRALQQLVANPGSALRMDGHEYAALLGRIDNPSVDAALPDEYALYQRQGTADDAHAAIFTILDKGVRVDLGGSAPADPADAAQTPAPWAAGQPIVAVMDDGVGFLNARFRRIDDVTGAHETRVHALWLQSTERQPGPGLSPGRVEIGTVLTRSEINAMLEHPATLNEAHAYGTLSTGLYGPRAHRSTDFAVSHGSHILDLAGGSDPTDADNPARNWPLLAVQLPPEAVADTSGTRFESYIVQGLRWILRQARQIDAAAPVIMNISMGILSGPKDGSRFAEYQISREARNWEEVTGQPVRIVWSFGNNYRSRQVAVFDFAPAEGRTDTDRAISWRIQPDDLTPSYLEIRTEADLSPEDFQVSLCPPQGTSSGFRPLKAGQHLSLETAGGGAVARIYAVPSHDLDAQTRTRGYHALCLGPTANEEAQEPLAPSGQWTVVLRYRGDAAQRITAQIQRGDSLPGYRPRGRQSYFDAPDAYDWDAETQDTGGLAPECDIKRQGSHSALVTSAARQVFCVGAAEWDPADAAFRPSLYSAQGADWCMAQPTASTLADDSRAYAGVLASGTFTGSIASLNGTSAAAGRLSRALALSANVIRANAAAGGGTQTDDIDRSLLVPQPVAASYKDRLGDFIVTGDMAARDRRSEAERPAHVPPAQAMV